MPKAEWGAVLDQPGSFGSESGLEDRLAWRQLPSKITKRPGIRFAWTLTRLGDYPHRGDGVPVPIIAIQKSSCDTSERQAAARPSNARRSQAGA